LWYSGRMTGPELFAIAHGTTCVGPHRCVLCGAPAAEPYALPDSFTTRDTLAAPGSGFRCAGCALAMLEVGEAVYPDGARYHFTKAFRRMCSWVVTATVATAATKAHLDFLRGVCLTPPPAPYLISLAVSGQKQVLYRSVVGYDAGHAVATIEGERIDYRAADLAARLALCGKVCAATGKPALAEPPGPSVWFRVCERYSDGEALCAEWVRVREEPLSRLASFLTPAKERCVGEHPGDRHDGVPPPGGRARRPDPAGDGGGRNRRHEGRREATLFGDV